MVKQIRLPLSLLPPKFLRGISRHFFPFVSHFKPLISLVEKGLKLANIDVEARTYVSMAFANAIISFVIFGFFFAGLLFRIGISWIFGIILSFILITFVFVEQTLYPKLTASRRARKLEKNLIPALQDLSVQLNSGVPLFNILTNLSKSGYGEVSEEFGKAVREISSGRPQEKAIEELGANSPSLFFRRTLWQISNGITSGADMSRVIAASMKNLGDEQLIQIQSYGSRLSPLAMFYMLIAVIIPALSVTFLTIVLSLISVSDFIAKGIFWGLLVAVIFLQIMFLGMIKSRRPSLI